MVVQEDGKERVDDSHEDERKSQEDGERETFLAELCVGEFQDHKDGHYGQGGVDNDVEHHGDFGGCLDGECAVGGDAVGAADDAEDEGDRDDELHDAELNHVEHVGRVRIDCVHTAMNFG